jgi:uncharacterized protein (TIRG00374 family)
MKQNTNKYIKTILKALISFGLLYVIMRGIKPSDIDLITQLSTKDIVGCSAVYLLTNLMTGIRWKWAVDGLGLQISYLKALNLTFIGFFFNNFLPSSIGGDLYKVYFFSKEKKNLPKAIASTMIDRMMGLMSSLVLCMVFGYYYLNQITESINFIYVYWGIGSLGLMMLILLLLFKIFRDSTFVDKTWSFIKNLLMEIDNFVRNQRVISIKIFTISIIINILGCFGIYICLISFADNSSVSFLPLMFLVPFIAVAALVPISINSIGLTEFLAVNFFGLLGYSSKCVLLGYLLWRIIGIVISFIGGIVFVLSKKTSQ